MWLAWSHLRQHPLQHSNFPKMPVQCWNHTCIEQCASEFVCREDTNVWRANWLLCPVYSLVLYRASRHLSFSWLFLKVTHRRKDTPTNALEDDLRTSAIHDNGGSTRLWLGGKDGLWVSLHCSGGWGSKVTDVYIRCDRSCRCGLVAWDCCRGCSWCGCWERECLTVSSCMQAAV